MNITASELVELYELKPHREGGYYNEIYRANGNIPGYALPEYGDSRCYCTSIYFLLLEDTISKMHRLKSDEIWHFYLGGSLIIVQIDPNGVMKKIVLGMDVKQGQKVQHVIPAGHWFGAYPDSGSNFCFVGCTVAPGFEYVDLEMGKCDQLVKEFPEHRKMIEFLT